MNPTLAKILERCKDSPEFFIENFCTVEHPTAGVLPFNLFSYQCGVLDDYRENRFNIFKKCRQCGISTLTGAYALWSAMFSTNKKILVVSKTDEDAKEFLKKNVKNVFNRLPDFLKEVFHDENCTNNAHEISFRSKSTIKSHTSNPETLRSSSAKLVIIDEAAFMQHMEDMWAGGQQTLMHGGSCIVISTCKGVGNWYWATWMDAVAGESVFNPIQINWWDMDWTIEYENDNGEAVQISPRKEVRPTKTEEERERYGPYWSPWLEEQYRALQRRGEGHLFKQEVLAEFLGSGNTVVDPAVLRYIGEFQEETKKAKYTLSTVDYEDPVTGESRYIDFDKQLWIWEKPVHQTEKTKGHEYVMGVDVSGGDNKDCSAIEVFDIDTQEQVAELNIKVNVAELKYMVDYLGRWYNTALVAVDKTGIGETLAKDLENEICYPRLWKDKKKPRDKGKVGLAISTSSKPKLNGALRENLGVDGFVIHSPRLYKQLTIYVNFGNGKTGNEPGPGNTDDCVLAAALAFYALSSAHMFSGDALAPFRAGNQSFDVPTDMAEARSRFGNAMSMMPFSGLGFEDDVDMKTVHRDELSKFAAQIGGLTSKKGESNEDRMLKLREEVNKKPASQKKVAKQITMTKPKAVARKKDGGKFGFASQRIVSNKKNR